MPKGHEGFIAGALVGSIAGYIGIEGSATEWVKETAHEQYVSAINTADQIMTNPLQYALSNPLKTMLPAGIFIINQYCEEGKIDLNKVKFEFSPSSCSF